MTATLIIQPFANSGDLAVIPQTDPNGFVNFTNGYTPNYEISLAAGNPAAKAVERPIQNALFNILTGNTQAWQQMGFSPWFAGMPGGYAKNALVMRDNGTGTLLPYRSLAAGNVTDPRSTPASWAYVPTPAEALLNTPMPTGGVAGPTGLLITAATDFNTIGTGTYEVVSDAIATACPHCPNEIGGVTVAGLLEVISWVNGAIPIIVQRYSDRLGFSFHRGAISGAWGNWQQSVDQTYANNTFAPINSPNLTGTPTAPTPPIGDMDTDIANMAALYSAADGLVNVSITTADVVLASTQYGVAILALSGALTAARNLIFPNQSGFWIIDNNTTAFPVTAKTASGASVPLSLGWSIIACDGVGIYLASLTKSTADATYLPISAPPNAANLTNLLYPSADGNWRDIYRAGWRPSWFNQQWGGAQWGTEMVDGATDNLYKFDVATGQIEDNNFGIQQFNLSSNQFNAEPFIVSEAGNYNQVWLKLYKVGNPSDNFIVKIYDATGSGGVPGVQVGTASASLSQKVFTSKLDGEWYLFTFSAPVALAAGTKYYLRTERSSGIDANNYSGLKSVFAIKYPSGTSTGALQWNGSVWSGLTQTWCFIIPNANQFLQPGGQFSNNKLVFSDNLPVNQSKSLVQPLRNFFDGNAFTALYRVNSCQIGKPIADFAYGLDHDRIQIMCNSTTGFASVNFWDKSRNLVTLTSAVNISTASFSDVAVNIRMMGDGSDYLQLWINGVMVASTAAQTYVVDRNMRELGTAWIGGGFPAAPVWTQDMQMTALPSAQGWTWSGTATEANAMSIQNGKLFQNSNGYASGNYGIYLKNVALNNATGWTATWKCRVATSTNNLLTTAGSAAIQVSDGTKIVEISLTEYFTNVTSSAGNYRYQGDYKSRECRFVLCGKGSDYQLHVNGQLVIDGTGQMVSTTSLNQIQFGDFSSTAGENADVIWSDFKYYQGGAILPQASTGAPLHEAAYWSGDHAYLLPTLYGSGSPVSVKKYCGVSKNYVEEVQWSEQRLGVINNPANTSASLVLMPDMELFVIGETISLSQDSTFLASVIQVDGSAFFVDGSQKTYQNTTITSNTYYGISSSSYLMKSFSGIHKIEYRWATNSGTVNSQNREMNVRSAK